MAVLFLIWSLAVSLSDNILKPMLMSRGIDVPVLVIFVGALGGFASTGLLGLFIGPVILALGYKLSLAWLEMGDDEEGAHDPEAAR